MDGTRGHYVKKKSQTHKEIYILSCTWTSKKSHDSEYRITIPGRWEIRDRRWLDKGNKILLDISSKTYCTVEGRSE